MVLFCIAASLSKIMLRDLRLYLPRRIFIRNILPHEPFGDCFFCLLQQNKILLHRYGRFALFPLKDTITVEREQKNKHPCYM